MFKACLKLSDRLVVFFGKALLLGLLLDVLSHNLVPEGHCAPLRDGEGESEVVVFSTSAGIAEIAKR